MRALVIDADRSLPDAMSKALPGIRWSLRPGTGRKSGVQAIGTHEVATALRHRHDRWSTGEAKRWLQKKLDHKLDSRTWQAIRDEACAREGWAVKGHARGAYLTPPRV